MRLHQSDLVNEAVIDETARASPRRWGMQHAVSPNRFYPQSCVDQPARPARDASRSRKFPHCVAAAENHCGQREFLGSRQPLRELACRDVVVVAGALDFLDIHACLADRREVFSKLAYQAESNPSHRILRFKSSVRLTLGA